MILLTHANIRAAIVLAMLLTLLVSSRLGQSQPPLFPASSGSPSTSVEPISNQASQQPVPIVDSPDMLASNSEAPEQFALFIIGSPIANLRSGPGQDHAVLLVANQGEQFSITGKSPDLTWIEVCCVGGGKAWIASQLGVIYGPIEEAPIKP